MVLHSQRIILLSMFYKAYLNVYYFYYSIKKLLLCLGKTTAVCLVSASLLRVEFGIQNPINNYDCSGQLRFLFECASVQSDMCLCSHNCIN